MQLTPHFRLEEFEQHGKMPEECVSSYTCLSMSLLEPIREHFGADLIITSGYRSPEDNLRAHGVASSQHVATDAFCAADWRLAGDHDLREVFDWIRLHSGLLFDQLILEHDSGGQGDIIHISWVRENPRRMALEGATHNRTAYISWPVT